MSHDLLRLMDVKQWPQAGGKPAVCTQINLKDTPWQSESSHKLSPTHFPSQHLNISPTQFTPV